MSNKGNPISRYLQKILTTKNFLIILPILIIPIAFWLNAFSIYCQSNSNPSCSWIHKSPTKVVESTKDNIVTKITVTDNAITSWDLLTVALVPAALAILGYQFQKLQQKAKEEKEVADKKMSVDKQREDALQAYFDKLS